MSASHEQVRQAVACGLRVYFKPRGCTTERTVFRMEQDARLLERPAFDEYEWHFGLDHALPGELTEAEAEAAWRERRAIQYRGCNDLDWRDEPARGWESWFRQNPIAPWRYRLKPGEEVAE